MSGSFWTLIVILWESRMCWPCLYIVSSVWTLTSTSTSYHISFKSKLEKMWYTYTKLFLAFWPIQNSCYALSNLKYQNLTYIFEYKFCLAYPNEKKISHCPYNSEMADSHCTRKLTKNEMIKIDLYKDSGFGPFSKSNYHL